MSDLRLNSQKIKEFPLQPMLLEAIKGIAKKQAREEALKILIDSRTIEIKQAQRYNCLFRKSYKA